MQQSFHPDAAIQFRPQERRATYGLLLRLLDEPDDIMGHLRLYVISIIPLGVIKTHDDLSGWEARR
jgi:hypothetical protein